MSKKICMILDHVFPPDIRVEKEARALIEAGFEVHLLCRRKGSEVLSEQLSGIHIHRFEYNPPKNMGGHYLSYYFLFVDNRWLKNIKATINRIEPDFFHVHDLPLVKTCLKAAKAENIPVIFDLHENWPEALKVLKKPRSSSKITWLRDRIRNQLFFNPSRNKKLESLCIRDAEHLVVVVEEQKDRLTKEGVSENKITVVKNSEDMSFFKSILLDKTVQNQYEGKFIISYVGGFSFARGLTTLVKAFSHVCQKMENAHLLLVGDGEDKVNLERLAKNLGISENVSFTGWVDFRLVPTYISISNVCVIPHESSGHTETTIPHKLFQYMGLAKPLVVTDVSPLKRIVEEIGSGLVVESGNATEMAEAILKLQDNSLSATMGQRGKEAVEKKYNWATDANELISLYQNIS